MADPQPVAAGLNVMPGPDSRAIASARLLLPFPAETEENVTDSRPGRGATQVLACSRYLWEPDRQDKVGAWDTPCSGIFSSVVASNGPQDSGLGSTARRQEGLAEKLSEDCFAGPPAGPWWLAWRPCMASVQVRGGGAICPEDLRSEPRCTRSDR